MKVVLIQDCPLGLAGEVREVAAGHARNYLLPRGLALPATADNIHHWEEKRRGVERLKARTHEERMTLGRRLEATPVKLRLRVGPKGQVYGSITAVHIATELARQGIEVERHAIELPQPLRQPGSYEVAVRLAPEVVPKLKVEVEAADGSSQTTAP